MPPPGFAGSPPNAHPVRWGEKQATHFLPQERSDAGGGGAGGAEGGMSDVWLVRGVPDQ